MFFSILLLFINNLFIFAVTLNINSMKKLIFLKTIIDYVWIMSIIAFPFLIVFIGFALYSNEPFDIPINISGININATTSFGKIGLIFSIVNFIIILFALYNFKSLLDNFRKKLIFEENTFKLLDKIGNLVILSASLYLISDLLGAFSKSTISVNLGFGPFLYLMALGLFFKVLSEVFIIGKRIKEDKKINGLVIVDTQNKPIGAMNMHRTTERGFVFAHVALHHHMHELINSITC